MVKDKDNDNDNKNNSSNSLADGRRQKSVVLSIHKKYCIIEEDNGVRRGKKRCKWRDSNPWRHVPMPSPLPGVHCTIGHRNVSSHGEGSKRSKSKKTKGPRYRAQGTCIACLVWIWPLFVRTNIALPNHWAKIASPNNLLDNMAASSRGCCNEGSCSWLSTCRRTCNPS